MRVEIYRPDPPPPPPVDVEIHLTEDEANLLMKLIGSIGGSGEVRVLLGELYDHFYRANILGAGHINELYISGGAYHRP